LRHQDAFRQVFLGRTAGSLEVRGIGQAVRGLRFAIKNIIIINFIWLMKRLLIIFCLVIFSLDLSFDGWIGIPKFENINVEFTSSHQEDPIILHTNDDRI
jgi:hypothetical protein